MKRIISISAILILTISSYSQSSYPLISPDKFWSIIDQDPHGGATTTTAYKFENDTVINGKEYLKVYECYFDSTFSIWAIYQNCFIREDSTGNVFRLLNNDSLQIYDFNLQVGDSTFTGVQIAGQDIYATVDTVDSILVNGNYRKRIVFDPYFQETWVEGIGSLTHILYPFSRLSTSHFDLSCVKESGITIYQNSLFEDCYIYVVGINDRFTKSGTLKITPNPIKDQAIIEIKNSNKSNFLLQVINTSGKIVRSYTFHGNKYVFLRDGLASGLYIVKITSDCSNHYAKLIVE